jgi:hypothetical protein
MEMTIIYFIVFVCQYVYLNYIFDKDNPNIVKSIYNYTLAEGIQHKAIIYRTNRKSKKVIMFFSGGYLLEYHYYIRKLMYDLDMEFGSIMAKYEFVCYEKENKSSFNIYDDVYSYISHLDNELGKIEELILIGFSAGGVVASHVMEKCKNMTCKKKIITYDTPWQVHENVDSFKNNWIYRFDIIFFWRVYNIYSKHYNYEDIKHHLGNTKWNNGSNELTNIIKNVHGCSHEEFLKMTEFNFDQLEDTQVYNIYSYKDPFAIQEISKKFIEKNKSKIKFGNKNIEKTTMGHCSDMAFSTGYLVDIVIAIQF